MKRNLSRIIALFLIVTFLLPYTVYAEWFLEDGSISVTCGETQSVSQGGGAPQNDNNPVITQRDPTTTTSNTITVNGGSGSANVTIKDVNMDTGSAAAITTQGNVTLTISGNNTVKSETTAIDSSGSLNIVGADPAAGETPAANASLTASGGTTGIDVDPAGQGSDEGDGSLEIGSGVDVTVVGGTTGVDANVTVDGGNLNAYGDVNGSGSADGVGIDGDLAVKKGTAAVYGDDIGVSGDVIVGTSDEPAEAPVATAIVHSAGTAVGGNGVQKANGSLKAENRKSYVPNYDDTMFYRLKKSDNFDIQGKYNGKLLKTTFGNGGFSTYIQVGSQSKEMVSNIHGASPTQGLKLNIDLVPQRGGQLLQVVYTVTNTTNASITFNMGTCADIMIGTDDSAVITPLENSAGTKIGFKMVSSDGEQFNFFGRNDEYVTDIDGFWYGRYPNQTANVFSDGTDGSTGKYDSGAAWSWLDETIGEGETATYSVLIGIGGKGSEEIAGGVVTPPSTPEPEPEPEPKPEPGSAEEPAVPAQPAAKPSGVLDIKLDTVQEVIDLSKGTQDGKPMETIAVEAEYSSGNAISNDAFIVVHKIDTTAESTVEDLNKDDVSIAFTVSYLHNGTVRNLPGKVKLRIAAPEQDLNGFVLVFVDVDGRQIEIPYTLEDGQLVFETGRIGLYMLIKK